MTEIASSDPDGVRERIEALIGRHLPGMTIDGEPTALSGGFWARLYSIPVRTSDQRSKRVVVRLMPEIAAGRREAAVQAWAAAAGLPTPAVFAHGIDSVEGAFMVMEWCPGAPPLGGLTLASALRDRGRSVRRLPGHLARAARLIHGQDPAGLAAALQHADIDPVELSAERVVERITAVADDPLVPAYSRDGFGSVASWLRDHKPTTTRAVLNHGDLHPFNLLVDGDQFMVVDWTNASIASPEVDIGLTAALLRCAPVPVPSIARRPAAALTHWLAERFITLYGPGIDRQSVDWWEVVQCTRAQAEAAIGRTRPGAIVTSRHPFEIAGPAMRAHVERVTGCRLTLPHPPSI